MRIALLTNAQVAMLGAGDWVQALKTREALMSLGARVQHFLLLADGMTNETRVDGCETISYDQLPFDFDVLHVLPGGVFPSQYIRWSKLSPKTLRVVSPGYWDSALHRTICRSYSGSVTISLLKFYAKEAIERCVAPNQRFYPFHLLLPNSEAEVTLCRKSFALRPGASVQAVPNGIDLPPEQQSFGEPVADYVLYPGVFAPRKNQLGFIKALRSTDLPVVFMGGPLEQSECRAYYAECQKEAPSHWRFLGRLSHGSSEFYRTMAGARVVCLASSCETPGLAALEAAAMGARAAITSEGGAREYFSFDAE
ncbi:MAG: glycosyltransferase, partial [Planctomycetota bacterium]